MGRPGHRLPRLLLVVAVLLAGCGRKDTNQGRPPIRVAVIGGMTLSGMWQALAVRFTADTGWPVELVVTGPKDTLSAAMRQGKVDLLTMHSSDQATNLVADGYALNMRPWARNEHAILGPPADPAGIRGGHDGAAALRRIAETRSPFVDFAGPGSRDVVHTLWKKAGIDTPKGDWLLKDESLTPQGILEYAAAHGAYVVVGRIPVLRGKMANSGGLVILVQGDPAMRRPYVVVEANPAKLPGINAVGARVLADYLVSEKARAFLADFAAKGPDGFPSSIHRKPYPPRRCRLAAPEKGFSLAAAVQRKADSSSPRSVSYRPVRNFRRRTIFFSPLIVPFFRTISVTESSLCFACIAEISPQTHLTPPR